LANAPDTFFVTGPNDQQVQPSGILVTPTGGVQGNLANLVNGGTVVTSSSGTALANFGSVTPTGSTVATGAQIGSVVTVLGTAASTTFANLPSAATVIGLPLLILNQGTAAVHIGGIGGDTIDNTAGATGVALTNGHRSFFTATAAGAWVSGPSGLVSS
jgi:hypothetical protein